MGNGDLGVSVGATHTPASVTDLLAAAQTSPISQSTPLHTRRPGRMRSVGRDRPEQLGPQARHPHMATSPPPPSVSASTAHAPHQDIGQPEFGERYLRARAPHLVCLSDPATLLWHEPILGQRFGQFLGVR